MARRPGLRCVRVLEALRVLFSLLRPLTRFHRAEGFPKLGERGNRFALFRQLARVLRYIFAEFLECFVLRLSSGAESLLFLAAHTLAIRSDLPDMEVADPNFSLAGTVDLLDPALRRFDSGQARSDPLNLALERRDERRTLTLERSAELGFGPARHDRNVHGRGSSGKFEVGG